MLIVFLMSKVESQDFLDPELIYSGGGGDLNPLLFLQICACNTKTLTVTKRSTQ